MQTCTKNYEEEITQMQEFLKQHGLLTHAQNFCGLRIKKQEDQYNKDILKFTHTALSNYITFHNATGQRIPISQRKTINSLEFSFKPA